MMDEARDAIEKALRLGTKDAKLFYHAGIIYRRLGELREGQGILKSRAHDQPAFSCSVRRPRGKTLKEMATADAHAAAN